jgi:hypothetical protein
VHAKRVVELVANADHDFGAFGNADQRRRHLQWSRGFTERLDLQCRPLVAFGTPEAGSGAELEDERITLPSPGRATVVVDGDVRQGALPCGRTRGCRCHRREQNQDGRRTGEEERSNHDAAYLRMKGARTRPAANDRVCLHIPSCRNTMPSGGALVMSDQLASGDD